jgi:hypothetical protein
MAGTSGSKQITLLKQNNLLVNRFQDNKEMLK